MSPCSRLCFAFLSSRRESQEYHQDDIKETTTTCGFVSHFNLMLKVKETYILFRWFEFFSSSSASVLLVLFRLLCKHKRISLSSLGWSTSFFFSRTVELNFLLLSFCFRSRFVCIENMFDDRLSMCRTTTNDGESKRKRLNLESRTSCKLIRREI